MRRISLHTSLSFSRFFCLLFGLGLVAATASRAETVIEQATVLVSEGNLIDAETLLMPLVGKRPDAAALNLMSQVRTGQMRSAEAVEFAERAVKADSGHPAYFCQLGRALTHRYGEVGPYEQDQIAGKIRKVYEKAVALDPKCLPALIGLCQFYYTMAPVVGGDLEKAGNLATRIRQLDPVDGETELASLAQAKQDFAGAVAHYEAANKLKPGDAALHIHWARCLLTLGRRAEARAQLEEALKIDPKLGEIRKMLDGLDKMEPPKP